MHAATCRFRFFSDSVLRSLGGQRPPPQSRSFVNWEAPHARSTRARRRVPSASSSHFCRAARAPFTPVRPFVASARLDFFSLRPSHDFSSRARFVFFGGSLLFACRGVDPLSRRRHRDAAAARVRFVCKHSASFAQKNGADSVEDGCCAHRAAGGAVRGRHYRAGRRTVLQHARHPGVLLQQFGADRGARLC